MHTATVKAVSPVLYLSLKSSPLDQTMSSSAIMNTHPHTPLLGLDEKNDSHFCALAKKFQLEEKNGLMNPRLNESMDMQRSEEKTR